MKTYKIIRFYRPDKQKTQPKNLPTGMSLDEAQEYCSSDATHDEDWFDGYTEE